MNNISYGRVAVLMGGISNEREISLKSGQAVLGALKELSIDAQVFDPKNENFEKLNDFDCAFICLHGKDGEDGKIQTYLDKIGLRYTGSGAKASYYGMNKYESKVIWASSNIPTPRFFLIDHQTNYKEIVKKLDKPFFVKASNSGSSLGTYKISDEEQFKIAYSKALEIDNVIFAEENISGRELTIPIVNKETLPIIEIIPKEDFYNYEAKYVRDDTEFICPAIIEKKLKDQLDKIALESFDAIGCSSWGRVDFMIDSSSNIFVIEINTIPGMTNHSLVPLSAKKHGIDFNTLVLNILRTAYA